MKNIPKVIYLNLGIPKRVMNINDRDDISFNDLHDVSWSTDQIDDQDLKFVLSSVSQQRELLEAFVKQIKEDNEFVDDITFQDINKFLSSNCG